LNAWETMIPMSDIRIYGPALLTGLFLVVAFVPGHKVDRVRARFALLANNAWVWFGLFAILWLYFAGWTLLDRYNRIYAGPPTAMSASIAVQSEWPLPSSEEIQALADKMSAIAGVKYTSISYADSNDEPLALAIAQAMHLAGWPEARIAAGGLILGTSVTAGSDVAAAGNLIRNFLTKKTGDQPASGGDGLGYVNIVIGRMRPK
jgi:hypothetical protein